MVIIMHGQLLEQGRDHVGSMDWFAGQPSRWKCSNEDGLGTDVFNGHLVILIGILLLKDGLLGPFNLDHVLFVVVTKGEPSSCRIIRW